MATEGYKKITKDDVDFPEYCLYFIEEIIDSLNEYEIENSGDELLLELSTFEYPYCYDAFELIVKTFKRKGFEMNLPSYKVTDENGSKLYTYKWKIEKK